MPPGYGLSGLHKISKEIRPTELGEKTNWQKEVKTLCQVCFGLGSLGKGWMIDYRGGPDLQSWGSLSHSGAFLGRTF